MTKYGNFNDLRRGVRSGFVGPQQDTVVALCEICGVHAFDADGRRVEMSDG